MYRYQFTNTVEDFREAEKVDRTVRSSAPRIPFRWVIVVMGVTWLVIDVIAFDLNNLDLRPIMWTFLGIGIFYYFVLRPQLKRNRIKRNNTIQQNVILEFDDYCIKSEMSGIGNFTRKWEELISFADTHKGVLFYFSDEVVNWIPNRVFSSNTERNNFISFLKNRVNQEHDQED